MVLPVSGQVLLQGSLTAMPAFPVDLQVRPCPNTERP